ncbi:cleavage polyadenylation factor subunit fip1, partial [Linderina pennispora]
MSSAFEDEDAFLYGDTATAATAQAPATDTEPANGESAPGTPTAGGPDTQAQPSAHQSDAETPSADEESGSEYGDDDDDDLEVILEPADADGSGTNQAEGGTAGTGAEAGKALGQLGDEKGSATTIEQLLATNSDRMDMMTVPLLKNIDLYKIDLDLLEEKPWRNPGADITDYFNFGFNEQTWRLYCLKQKQLRADFSVRKIMPTGMMMPMGNPGMFPGNPMMPPGMVPPFMRQQMPPGAQKPRDGGRSDDDDEGRDGGGRSESRAAHSKDGQQRPMMTPQQMQYQQQMRMNMPMQQGYYPPGMPGGQRNMPMNMNRQGGPMMNPQMQMGGRPPMPHGGHQQGMNPAQRGPGTNHGQQPREHYGSQRDDDRGSESGRSSRRHGSRERSSSRMRQRDRDEERPSRRDRDRPRERDGARDKADSGSRRPDRRRERSRERG